MLYSTCRLWTAERLTLVQNKTLGYLHDLLKFQQFEFASSVLSSNWASSEPNSISVFHYLWKVPCRVFDPFYQQFGLDCCTLGLYSCIKHVREKRKIIIFCRFILRTLDLLILAVCAKWTGKNSKSLLSAILLSTSEENVTIFETPLTVTPCTHLNRFDSLQINSVFESPTRFAPDLIEFNSIR